MKKICICCGLEKDITEFSFRKDTNKYRNQCKDCRKKREKQRKIENESKIKEKVCPICKEKFKPRRNSQKYCSAECRAKSTTKKITIECSYCGEEISVTANAYKRNKHHYCSKDCRYKHQKEIFKGKNNPNYKNASINVMCSNCKKSFSILKCNTKNSDGTTKKNFYCSQECKSEHQKKILKGENNPNYGKGEKIRGNKNKMWNPNKPQEEREKGRIIQGYKKWVYSVYKRDNYTCQCCGKRGGDLVAHHLNSYNWDKEHRIDVNNGITLCEKCHRDFHIKYGMGDNTKEQYEQFINNK